MSRSAAERYDVVVVGGGSAGISAAVGAARLGARTLLIERYGFLGGAATNAQVFAYCGFFLRGDQARPAVAGVGADLLAELRALGMDTAPVRSNSHNWVILLDGEAVKLACDRLVTANGVELRLHTRLIGARCAGARIAAITVADHAGVYDIEAGCFVDASGEAGLSAAAQVPMSNADLSAKRQPASLPLRIGGIAPSVTVDRVLLADLLQQYNRTARLPIPRDDAGILMRLPGSGDLWWLVIDLATDGITGTDLTRAERDAREQAWDCLRLLRRHPGCEKAYLLSTGPQLGIRETRRPRSACDATQADALGGRLREDGIGRAAWPMEVHEAPGRPRFVPIGGAGYFDVPHGALLAEGVSNLRLAGRVVGSDAQAYGSIRVMGTAFATGHAAGISAALAGADGAACVAEVRRILAAQHAII